MRRSLQSIAVLFGLALLSVSLAAQSGRKQKKADSLPPVQGVNQPEARTVPESTVAPEATDKRKEEEERTVIEVMSQIPDIGVPIFYADTARRAFLQELRKQAQNVNGTDGGGNKNRKDAMDAAKNAEKLYAVLLELNTDSVSAANTYGFDLRYTVFEPKTGKQIVFGSGYPVQPNSPQPPIGASRAEVYIEWAARDAANQVVSRLKLKGSF